MTSREARELLTGLAYLAPSLILFIAFVFYPLARTFILSLYNTRSTGVPTTFGVITALTEEQAWARAGGDVGNRGEEAAEAALQMAEWIRQLGDHRAGRTPARSGHVRRR